MSIHIQAPAKYIQGPNELANLAAYCKNYSDEAYVLVDAFILTKYGANIKNTFEIAGYKATLEAFKGECSYNEIDRIGALIKQTNAGVVVGIGVL